MGIKKIGAQQSCVNVIGVGPNYCKELPWVEHTDANLACCEANPGDQRSDLISSHLVTYAYLAATDI